MSYYSVLRSGREIAPLISKSDWLNGTLPADRSMKRDGKKEKNLKRKANMNCRKLMAQSLSGVKKKC